MNINLTILQLLETSTIFCWFCALAFHELVTIWLGPFRNGGMLMSQVVGYRVLGWSPSRCRVPPLGQGDDNFNHMWHIRRSAIAIISPTWIYQEIIWNLHGMVRNDQSYECPKVTQKCRSCKDYEVWGLSVDSCLTHLPTANVFNKLWIIGPWPWSCHYLRYSTIYFTYNKSKNKI